MSIEAALIHEQQVDRMVQQVMQQTSVNSVWIPDDGQTAQPSVRIITTTGTGIGDFPTHWYEPYGPSPLEELWRKQVIQPQHQPAFIPMPQVQQPEIDWVKLLEEMQKKMVQASGIPPAFFEPPKVEEPVDEGPPPVKKYSRKLEP